MKKNLYPLIILTLLIVTTGASAGDITSLLPKDGDIKGWTRKGAPRVYAHSELWEYINGGADVYLDYGFLRVATVELHSGSRSIVVDLYEFKQPLGAFGMYARERAPTYSFKSFGAEGYHEGVALNFHQGVHYAKLNAFNDDAVTRAVMPKIAQLLSRRIGGSKKPPRQLSLLPSGGKEKHTDTFEMKSYVDLSGLRQSFTARYVIAGKKSTYFFCETGNPREAKRRFNGLRSSLTKTGSLDMIADGLGDAVLSGVHREAGDILFVLKGKYICGIHPAVDHPAVRKFLRGACAKLK